MNEFYIPANFEEGGKIMGVFGVRNIIEEMCIRDRPEAVYASCEA